MQCVAHEYVKLGWQPSCKWSMWCGWFKMSLYRFVCWRMPYKLSRRLPEKRRTNWWVHIKLSHTKRKTGTFRSNLVHETCSTCLVCTWQKTPVELVIYCTRVKPVASQKCAALCLNSCLVCNYVDIYYVRKQPNKVTIKQKTNPTHSKLHGLMLFKSTSVATGGKKCLVGEKQSRCWSWCVNHTSHITRLYAKMQFQVT